MNPQQATENGLPVRCTQTGKLKTGVYVVNHKPQTACLCDARRQVNCKLETGFTLITAIFLLVVIAALGTFAVTLSTTQHQSQTMDVMGARAYQAALAGVEWAAFQVASSPANAVSATTCATVFPLNTLAGNLAPFTVTVNCSATSAVEGVGTTWVYSVSSVAHTTGVVVGNANYVEQVATAKMAR